MSAPQPSPCRSEGTGRRVGLDPDAVLDRALAIVEAEGADALSMRRLAADLGVTTTTVYWHVGGRDAVVAGLLERASHRLAAEGTVTGEEPRARVLAAALAVWDAALAHPELTGLAHRVGASGLLMLPLHVNLLRELDAAGLRGDAARAALESILGCIAGFLVLRLRPLRHPDAWSPDRAWATVEDAGIDAATLAALAAPGDPARQFESTLRAVLGALIPTATSLEDEP